MANQLAHAVCDWLAWEGKTCESLCAQLDQSIRLLDEIVECAASADSLESLQSYRDEWFEMASSIAEIESILTGWTAPRRVLPYVFVGRAALLFAGIAW